MSTELRETLRITSRGAWCRPQSIIATVTPRPVAPA
jgi:hypothetical protein